jgi:hypothetical protein
MISSLLIEEAGYDSAFLHVLVPFLYLTISQKLHGHQCLFQEFCDRAKVAIIHKKIQQMW